MSKTEEPTKLLITVLSTSERTGWHHPSISAFLYALRFEQRFMFNYAPVSNFSPAASGRNVISKHFKESEADILMMVDNDMDIPPNILDTLKDAPADWGVIVPTFYLWNGTKPSVTLCWGMPKETEGVLVDGDKEYFNMRRGFHQLTKCGTGVIFIKREVFDKITYPYFEYKYDEHCGMRGTEDISFCEKAIAAGVKIYGTTEVRVGHWHQVNLLTLADMVYNGLGIDPIQKPVDKHKTNGVSSAAEIASCPAAI